MRRPFQTSLCASAVAMVVCGAVVGLQISPKKTIVPDYVLAGRCQATLYELISEYGWPLTALAKRARHSMLFEEPIDVIWDCYPMGLSVDFLCSVVFVLTVCWLVSKKWPIVPRRKWTRV